ncbi:MAG: hypothetical protein FWG73_02810 [Planctomycetaceae bacterium]|nr:hypothetical protein [Planctomycetaceae bacterium]
MIISPEGLAITNVLHAVNNSYKCTNRVYMFSQTEEDCNLYIKKLYWERDPESDYEAPVFPFPRDSIMLIRQDLTSILANAHMSTRAILAPEYRLHIHVMGTTSMTMRLGIVLDIVVAEGPITPLIIMLPNV